MLETILIIGAVLTALICLFNYSATGGRIVWNNYTYFNLFLAGVLLCMFMIAVFNLDRFKTEPLTVLAPIGLMILCGYTLYKRLK